MKLKSIRKINYTYSLILSLFLAGSIQTMGQDNSKKEKSSLKISTNRANINLSKALESKTVSNEELAIEYEKAAKEATTKAQSDIAEDYYSKARDIYSKIKNKEKIAEIDREIAKIQEQRKEFAKAFSNYSSASRNSVGVQKKINTNDAQRLQPAADLQSQSQLLQSNIDLLNQTNQPADLSFANKQMAEVNLKLDNKDAAVMNLKDALKDASTIDEKVMINKNIADVYLSEEKDIMPTEEFSADGDVVVPQGMMKSVESASATADVKKTKSQPQIEQVKVLQKVQPTQSDIAKEDIAMSLQFLLHAYQTAIDNNQTLEANKILLNITDIYTKQNQYNEAINLYQNFSQKLPSLFALDSTLQDPQIYSLVNEKIKELEKNRSMNDLLIKRKNTINYTLIAVITLIIIILIVVVKYLYTIRKKNKHIALQSLRREMNPHFIFNSLNSVNQFIAQNNELEANKYLSSYSKLMRTMMENSNNDFIPLSVELSHLQQYLDLEYMRFSDKFMYAIQVDDTIDTENTLVPNMLLQPHLENAIWHGLRYSDVKGLLSLSVKDRDTTIEIIVQDNGIGLEKSKQLKTNNQKTQKSRGVNNTKERINLLNSLYKTNITLTITDKVKPDSGVIVVLIFAKQHK